ncbi:class I SAM-dependent methyltransferase [Halorussus aquaticus]|uniref:Class I SAM-dependent methyltransferase n=1 Tax=Halorussus aquaticus TaxID=2953748 RepID=A0ABD5Q917_9EURY|nr:class I SAM-dependent methyltransferase [Halorussus aquaticus]
MQTWDERFRDGDYPQNPDPSPILRRYLGACPDGRALDVATGTGRNAVFLAEEGYQVDGIEQSIEGLRIARRNATNSGVAERTNWIQADVPTYAFPESTYDVATISFYRAVDRFPDIKEALTPNGVLFVEHHLRSSESVQSGPSGDRYRFAANELLHACLDLTVLYYDERTETRDDGRSSAVVRIVARNSSGHHQSYPQIDSEEN